MLVRILTAAENFYRVLGFNKKDVLEKVRTDEIIIGPPMINSNEMLSIREGRYHIVELIPEQTARKNQEVH